MTGTDTTNDAKRLRLYAEEARTRAEGMSNRDSKQAMLQLAEAYEKLAQQSQPRADKDER